MRRLRIALVSPYDYAYPGGVSEHVSQLDRSLRDLGHATLVIAPSSALPGTVPSSHLVPTGRVVCVPTNGSVARITLSLGLSRQVKRIMRENQFDVVHVHEPFMPLLPFLVLRHSDAANVGTFHAYSGNERGYQHGRWLLSRFSDRLHARIAVSETARSFVARHFPGEYAVIPNGVDVQRFQSAAPLPGLVDGTPNVLFVGRLDERKGFRYLLRAFALLRRSGVIARLIVVGAYGPAQQQRYESLVAALDVPDVVFAGYASPDQLPRYYQSAEVVCAPSLGGESFGVVLAEAMAAGKSIVASRIAGYREVVDHGVEGLLVPPSDSLALSDALRRVLADRELRLELGRRGRQKAARFAWPLVAERILDCYNTAMIAATGVPDRGAAAPPLEGSRSAQESLGPPVL
ncbi:MAG TPA: glycosyltransferase family 4 protein [Chloroflexota bacterium]|nr:glycosyltransferase family 4 protein [Chloroflexota bacterium]